ncbi:MAG: haloacid dehalogenase type II [Phycisphaerae bacterium]
MGVKVIVFDLNGTLLDMRALDPVFKRLFGRSGMRERWFLEMQALWMAMIPTDAYVPFDKVARAAVEVVAGKVGVAVPRSDADSIAEGMKRLPCFVEVTSALARLKEAEYRLVALTNGTKKAAKAQVKFAEIGRYLEEVYSVEQVEQFKPGPKAYLHVAEETGVKPGKMLMVAAHAWDLDGAHMVGCSTAFVKRPGQVLNPLAKKPDFVVEDLWGVVEALGA